MKRILLVDDHPLFREGFAHMARVLRPAWHVHVADNAQQALALLQPSSSFEVVLIDVGLPGDDGFTLAKTVATKAPSLPLIFISGRDDAAVRMRAQAAGVRSFIAKSQSPESIIDIVETVLAGQSSFADTGPLPTLTARQAEVLMLLAAGHGNKEIRHRLNIAERTVRAHLTDIFQLLGANSRMQALIRARELGMIG